MALLKKVFVTTILIFCCLAGFSQSGIQFIENKNQWPRNIDFGVRVGGGSMFVQPGGFSYYFLDQKKLEMLHDKAHDSKSEASLIPPDEEIDGQMIQVKFLGSNPLSKATPFQPVDTYYNYFLGSDPSSWASKVKAYEGVYYSSVYDCIDLKLYSSGDFLKYDFIMAAGADPSQIKIQYNGVNELSVSNGDFHVKAPQVSILEKKPEAFQMIDGKKIAVKCEYVLENHILGFSFPDGYDECHELVIDPLLIFSTYSGSTADNWGSTATPGERGTLYSSGVTNHLNAGGVFPATPGSFQTTYGGIYDVAILKYDSIGQHLLYASFLGGTRSESPHSLVINKNNELLILGTTSSTNFPTTLTAFDRTFNGGTPDGGVIPYEIGADIFVARISKDGTQLLSSTYIGGSANDGLNPSSGALTANYGDAQRGDILSDGNGNVYISTVTGSADFPAVNSFSTTYKGGATDAVVVKLNPDLSQITWGAFLGGFFTDASHTIKLDKTNSLFVAGGTTSSDFPTTTGTYQTSHAGSVDGWIANIANDGSSLIASTLTGTPAFNQIYFLELNSNDEVYVYGQTVGTFPVTAGVYSNNNAGQFIQKFTKDLKTLKFSTVFGSGRGIPDISPTAFLVNDCNNIYVSGWGGLINTLTGHWPGSNTVGMPISSDAFQTTTSGSDFYFMVLTDDASTFLYGTYLGGTQSRTHVDGGTSRFDKGGIVYHAVCSGCVSANAAGRSTSDFPTTTNAWSRTNNSGNCNNAAFKFDLSTLKARIQTNNVKLNSPGLNRVCMPDKIVFQNRSIGGKTFEWKLGDGTVIIKPDTSAITHQYLAPGQYIVKLKAYDNGTCLGKDSTTTVINVFKPQGKAGSDAAICKNNSVQIIATGGVSYLWKDSKNTFTSSEPAPTVTPGDTTRYFVSITDSNGCVTKDTVKVSVVPGIEVDLEVFRIFKCESRPAVNVINLSDKDETTYIDFGDGTTSDQSSFIHNYEQDGIYTVRVVGKKEFCVYEKGVTFPFFKLFVPNVITPGGSPGYNDSFKIKYGDALIVDTDLLVSLVVFNRWGTKVYEDKNYKNNWSAEGLVAGTYFYEVEIGGEKVCKSWVEVIK
ncbi:hypothetical protein BH09BAC3_BH09BAC3_21130 [soil metagenome]